MSEIRRTPAANPLGKRLNTLLLSRLVLPAVMRRGGLALASYLRTLEQFDSLPPSERDGIRLERLRNLVRHAAEHSPWYAETYGAAGVSARDLQSMDDVRRLPPLTKSELVGEKYRRLLSGPVGGVERVQTAGTTGLPVTVLKDRANHARQIAHRIYGLGRLGIRYGSREARFWGRSDRPTQRSRRDLLLNRQVFAMLGRTDDALRTEAQELLDFHPDYFYGYSSLVLRTAEVWRRFELPVPRLDGIVCTAESLTPAQGRFISEVFDCPVAMEYGCSEVDIIAMQCSAGTYHVLDHHLLLEIEPAGADRGGALITDLDNFSMPLIRYRLGDDLALRTTPCPCGSPATAIESVEGRTLTQVLQLPSGRTVHAVVFAHLFEALANEGFPVLQFRVRQVRTDRFEAQVELEAPTDQAALAEQIRRRTCDKLEESVEVETRFEAVTTAPGEKFTYFVPLD